MVAARTAARPWPNGQAGQQQQLQQFRQQSSLIGLSGLASRTAGAGPGTVEDPEKAASASEDEVRRTILERIIAGTDTFFTKSMLFMFHKIYDKKVCH
jgi:hypothetical protein